MGGVPTHQHECMELRLETPPLLSSFCPFLSKYSKTPNEIAIELSVFERPFQTIMSKQNAKQCHADNIT